MVQAFVVSLGRFFEFELLLNARLSAAPLPHRIESETEFALIRALSRPAAFFTDDLSWADQVRLW
jgi:hypothetical protein